MHVKTVISTVICALGVGACAGSNPPAQDPSTVAAEGSAQPGSAGAMGATSMMGAGTDSSVPPMTGAQDHNGAPVATLAQGTSKGELAITASIRGNVMNDPSLSFTAKNVEIITVGTKVTLRGHVRTDSERTTIENLARLTSRVTDVDNQIEVMK